MDDRPPEPRQRRAGYRSLFWPMLLIAVGIVWLLGNVRLIEPVSLLALLPYWPVLLIAMGLDLLLGRSHPLVGALIGVLLIVAVIGILFIVPPAELPTWSTGELETERFTEPLGPATSATVRLDLADMPATVTALDDSEDLIDATLTHRGRIVFDVRGDTTKSVSLAQVTDSGWVFDFGGRSMGNWEIGLTPRIPLRLEVEGGSGRGDLNISDLQLDDFYLDVDSGQMRAVVPAMESRYSVRVEGGSGRLDLELPRASQIDLDLDVDSGAVGIQVGAAAALKAVIQGGSGSLTIDVPDDAAVRFRVTHGGSGGVHLPSTLRQVSDGGDSDRDTGTWETPGFSSAQSPIDIELDLNSGSVTLR